MLTYSFIPEASLALSFTEQIQKILIDLLGWRKAINGMCLLTSVFKDETSGSCYFPQGETDRLMKGHCMENP